ncbi:hypothetical protein Cni_G04064 [Canna indica]|uniref:Uncharacterized protein n=1 Tax=Canna indica TaxID=4628 RepID=A0AAQ3JUT0_9LILI|nr:hypothetical protein Cni_G04064 [Canna indica]
MPMRTWSRNHTSASLSVKAESGTLSNTSKTRSRVLWKKKGSRCFLAGDSFVSLHWDVSAASYGSSPEPTKGFYLVAVADTELGLLLDDMCVEFVRRTFEGTTLPPIAAECSTMNRMEEVRRCVNAYTTKAALGSGGRGRRERRGLRDAHATKAVLGSGGRGRCERGGLEAKHLRGREEGGGPAKVGWVDGRP